VQSPRLPGESDGAFVARAERAAAYARILVDACFGNTFVQELLATGQWTEDSVRRSPTVRVEYDQAIAIGGIGETLDATKSKHWGDGPYVCPLNVDDRFYPYHITYLYRENSLYNRRFEQRMRMKELLGRYRPLVEHAKCRYTTKALFLKTLTDDQAAAIRRVLNVEPGDFWRACKGKLFLNLPKPPTQLLLFEI
jgi:hypothetical protein